MTTPRKRVIILVAAWIALIALSMLLDRPVANFAKANNIPQWLKSTGLATVLKIPGEYFVTAVLAAVATYFYARQPKWHAGAFILLCGLISGVNGFIKWIAGRARPYKMLASKQDAELNPFYFQPFFHGISGMFGTSNLCFPSGHAALAFANAAGLAILFPRWRWAFYAVASLTAAERFLETAHYFSDTVAAAALGIGGAHLLAWLFGGRSDVTEPRGFEPVMTQGRA